MLKEAFGINLKKLRKLKGITQEELSEQIGMNARQISKLETGSHFPSVKNLEKICMALGVQPWELFSFDMEGCPISVCSEIPYSDKLIQNFSNDKSVYEFFQLAVGALQNNQDLEKLEALLSGIKLARSSPDTASTISAMPNSEL